MLFDVTKLEGDDKPQAFNTNACGLSCNLKATCSHRFDGKNLKRSDVLFVYDSPTLNDEKRKNLLAGEAGSLFKECVGRSSFSDYEVTTLIDCAYEGTGEDPKLPDFMVKTCASNFENKLKIVSPRVVVAMGTSVANYFAGESTTLPTLRGVSVPYADRGFHVLFTVSPSYILKRKHYKGAFVKDIQKVPDLLRVMPQKKNIHLDVNNTYLKTVPEILDYLDSLYSEKRWGFDIETVGVNPFFNSSKLVSSAFSTDGVNSKGFRYLDFNDIEQKKLLDKTAWLLSKSKALKIIHRAAFETKFLGKKLGIKINDPIRDTLLEHYLLDERVGIHELKEVVWRLFGYKDFKGNIMEKYKTCMDKCPPPLLINYNCNDAKVLISIADVFDKTELFSTPLKNAYTSFVMPAVEALKSAESCGVLIDMQKLEDIKKKLIEQEDSLSLQIEALPYVIDYKKSHPNFNIKSNPQLQDFLFNYLKLPHSKTTKSGFSVDKGVLAGYTDNEFCNLSIQKAETSKLISTYVEGIREYISDDGRIHCNFNLTSTETGRLSSSAPNLQNIPKRKNSYIRAMYVADPGCTFISADYKQAEVVVLGYYTKDPKLVKYLKDPDSNMHTDWAVKIYGEKILVDQGTTKKFRDKVKNGFVFPLFYGAGLHTVANGLGLSKEEVEPHMNAFWEQFNYIKEWQDALIKNMYKKGYVETFFGRRRRLPLTVNEAINFPIQSTASDFTLHAMIQLNKMGFKLPINVHDNIVVSSDDNHITENVETLQRVMTTLPWAFAKEIPIRVDIEIGKDWANLMKWEDVITEIGGIQ